MPARIGEHSRNYSGTVAATTADLAPMVQVTSKIRVGIPSGFMDLDWWPGYEVLSSTLLVLRRLPIATAFSDFGAVTIWVAELQGEVFLAASVTVRNGPL